MHEIVTGIMLLDENTVGSLLEVWIWAILVPIKLLAHLYGGKFSIRHHEMAICC